MEGSVGRAQREEMLLIRLRQLERRAADFLANPKQGVPWGEIRADLKKQHGWS